MSPRHEYLITSKHRGSSLTEYATFTAIIVLAIMGAVSVLGTNLREKFELVSSVMVGNFSETSTAQTSENSTNSTGCNNPGNGQGNAYGRCGNNGNSNNENNGVGGGNGGGAENNRGNGGRD